MKKHLFTALLLLAAGFSEARETLPHESAAAETLRFTPATRTKIRFHGSAAHPENGLY